MKQRGLICKENCRLTTVVNVYAMEVSFQKGKIYTVIPNDSSLEWCVVKEGTKVIFRGNGILQKYFIPYRPCKKKSKYKNWKYDKMG